jgi:internalin A
MDNASLQSLLKRLCNVMWAANVTNPITYVTQISFLLFLKMLEEMEVEQVGLVGPPPTKAKPAKAGTTNGSQRPAIFTKVKLSKDEEVDFAKLRWSTLTSDPDNDRMLRTLAETHVLNPEWVTNGIYKILNADWLMKRQGVLELGHLAGVLDRDEYPKAMHLYLLDLMRKFELCYEMHDGDGHYLVPELLGKEEPDLQEFSGAEALRFDYRYNILPEGLLPRFIVRSRALNTVGNKNLPRWRTGVVLAWEGNRAVVKADLQDRTVSIAVLGAGTGRRRLLSVIRSDLDVIHRFITKLEATEEVPVPGQPGLAIGYQELRALEEAGEKELTRFHKGKLVKVQIADLLNGVEDASTRPSEPKREAGAREGVRVAFSYSHKDEALRDQLETHLKLLQRNGVITTWHDRKLMAGDKWAGVIDDKFQSADIILLLVSADFLASDYCYEIELKTALERAAKSEVEVVPIILRTCDWADAPFAKFQALPKDAVPVVKWTHPDDAWTDVERGIKKLAEERRKRGG